MCMCDNEVRTISDFVTNESGLFLDSMMDFCAVDESGLFQTFVMDESRLFLDFVMEVCGAGNEEIECPLQSWMSCKWNVLIIFSKNLELPLTHSTPH